jgi:hypothetical protein
MGGMRVGALAQPGSPLIPGPACGEFRAVALRELACKVSPSDCVHPSRRERPDVGGVYWRRGWDSNPRALSDKTLSRRPRYDHFGTSPIFTSLSGAPLDSPPRGALAALQTPRSAGRATPYSIAGRAQNVASGLVGNPPAHDCPHDLDVLDRVRRDGVRVVGQKDVVCELTGRDRPLDGLFA